MDFALTEEQQLIAHSASDWLLHHYDFRQREASLYRDGGNPAVWQAMAELGWLGLVLPDDMGGLALGVLESGLLAQALGRQLVVEPWIDSCLVAARLLALTGSQAQQQAWLPGVVAGTHRLAMADARPTLRAHAHGAGWVLDGQVRCVPSAPGAARWLLCATLGDGDPALFLVDPQSAGIAIDAYNTSDGGRAADLRLASVQVNAASRLSEANVHAALPRVRAEGLVARCWAATGAMQAALEQTTAYVQQRRQFGQPLAAFQVVQHRLAEMAVACTEAQAGCELAALSLATASAADCTVHTALLKSKLARAARYVSQECVQLHGAMGVCEELPIASTFRTLLAFAQWDGDGAAHALQAGRALLANGRFAQSRTLGPCATPLEIA